MDVLSLNFIIFFGLFYQNEAVINLPRIINGDAAKIKDFPYQVGIVAIKSNIPNYCGGAIIGNTSIITAGHCLFGTDFLIIYYGTVHLDNPDKMMVTTKYFIHKDYNNETFKNDIGVVLLENSLTFTKYIQPIDLADDELKPDTEVVISGWGLTTSSDTSKEHDVLHSITLKTISNEECIAAYGPDILQDEIVCTEITNPIKNPCKGDGGDPVVISDTTSKKLVALFSFMSNFGCENPYFPAAYTRIAPYRQWIHDMAGI